MIIHLFRRNYFIQYLFLLVFAVLLWSDVLLYPELILKNLQSTGIDRLDNFVADFPRIMIIISLVVLILQAFILNQVLIRNYLTDRNQLLTSALYILLWSSSPVLLQPNVVLLVSLTLVILLNVIFRMYGKPDPYGQVFDAAFLVGIASLIYFPAIFFIAFIWMCFIVYQIFTWREWIISFIGFLLPYFFIGTYFFWTDQLVEKALGFADRFLISWPPVFTTNTYTFIIWSLIFLLVLVSMGHILRNLSENKIDQRKKNRVLVMFFVITVASVIYSGDMLKLHLALLAIPVSAFLSSHFSETRRLLLPEIITLLILVVVVVGKIINLN